MSKMIVDDSEDQSARGVVGSAPHIVVEGRRDREALPRCNLAGILFWLSDSVPQTVIMILTDTKY